MQLNIQRWLLKIKVKPVKFYWAYTELRAKDPTILSGNMAAAHVGPWMLHKNGEVGALRHCWDFPLNIVTLDHPH